MKIKHSIVIGAGQLALNCAKLLLRNNVKVEIYEYNAYDMSLLKKRCQDLCIEYHACEKKELTDALLNISEDTFIVSANNTYIFPIDVIKNKYITAINFHPALLPLYPGRNAECWAIYNMDGYSGVTWHFINEDIDKGEIILQRDIHIEDSDTSLSLMMKQFKIGIALFDEIIELISGGGFENIKTKNNYTKKEDIHFSTEVPNDGCLDIDWPIEKSYAFCRSMDYGPLKVLGEPYCEYQGGKYIWNKYRIENNEDNIKTDVLRGIFADKKKVLVLEGWQLK